MAKWQKVTIEIPKGYSPIARQAIAQDVIQFIIERTRSGKDKDGKAFPGTYSKSYIHSKDYSIAGKPKGGKPIDLTLSGNMLDSLGLLSEASKKIVVGYDKSDEKLNGQVEGNILGTYGGKAKSNRARDFLGISASDLKRILDRYPMDEADDIAADRLDAAEKAGDLVDGVEIG